jgi:hypothetical protein
VNGLIRRIFSIYSFVVYFNFFLPKLTITQHTKCKKISGVPLNVKLKLLLIEKTGSAIIMAAMCAEHGVEKQTVNCV